MAYEFVARNGIISSGSITLLTGSLIGPVIGTSSYAITASHALNTANSFTHIQVPGQDTIVADGQSDTLIISGGYGITVQTDTTTDTITILSDAAAPQAFVIHTYEFIADGTTTSYNIVNTYDSSSLIVSVDGLTFNPDNDYTVSTNTIQFVTAPFSESIVLVRAFVNATQGVTGTFIGSLLGSASYATTASYALNGGTGGQGFPFVGDAVITGSLYVVSGGITGSFYGDGSGLQNIGTTANLIIDGGFADTEFDETDIIFDGGGA